MGVCDVQLIEDGDNVTGSQLQRIGFGIMGFVAGAMPPCIDEDESVVVLQRVNIPAFVPGV